MKISSLHKLTDIRSNKPGMNLLHYVAQQIEATQPDLLTVVDDLAMLEEASKLVLRPINIVFMAFRSAGTTTHSWRMITRGT